MNSKNIEETKKRLELTKEQREILVGLMLGDGCLESQNKGRTFRLKIEQSNLHKDYVDWLYGKFKEFVLTEPKTKIKTIGEKKYLNYGFQTLSCGNLRFFAYQFYSKKLTEKQIPRLIKRFLTPLALTIWFMDDGQIKSRKHRALLINSQCYSRNDLRLLQNALEEKFNIKTTLKKEKRGFRIYLLSETINNFLELVSPYILPSMKYKLGINIIA